MSGCHGGHDHGEGGGSHTHDDAELGIQYSLYSRVDMPNVTCLNESVDGAGKAVLKPWEDRLSDVIVESDVDQELLFNIPFTGQVKLKGIIVIGGEDGHHPNRMRLFKDRPHMTFDETEGKADQEFELTRDTSGTLEYPTRVVTFSSITSLSIHIPDNLGGEETTKVQYIGLKGEFTKGHQHGVTICNYELTPQVSDHKDKAMDSVGRPVM